MAKKEKKEKKAKSSNESKNYIVLDEETNKIRLNNVRLSFPALFTPKAVGADKEGTPKFSGVFLLDDDQHADTITSLH